MQYYKNKSVILLSVSNFLFYFSTGIFFFLPVYITGLGVSKFYIGFIMALPSIVQITIGFKVRDKIDFINKKTALLVTSLLSILVFILYYFFKNIYIIPFIRILHSVIISTGILFGISMAVDLIPAEKRKSGIGLYSLTGALPFLFAPMTAELIIRRFDFKYVFLLAAFISLLRFILTWFIPKPENKPKKKNENKAKIIDYIRVIPFVVFYGALYAALYKFLSAYSIQLKILYVSAFFQARVVFTFLVRLSFHKKIDRWNNSSILIYSFISGFTVLFLAYLLKFYPFFYVLIIMGAIYGSIHGVLYPALNVLFIEKTPLRSGKATIIFVLTKNIGIAFFALLFGFIADYTGYNKMYLAMSILMLLPVFYLIFNKKKNLV